LKSKEIEINEEVLILERRLTEMLTSTSTPIEYLVDLISKGETLLYVESIFKAISEKAKGIKRRKPSNSNLNISVISSSLGRGGAERQVVACLDGLTKNKKIGTVKLFCFGADNTGGAQETYIPEIEEIGIEMIEFGKLRDWNNGFENEQESLKPWRNLLDLFPKRFLREIEPLYLHFMKEKPDIVHTWQDQTNINAGLAALMAGVPGIVMFARSQRPDAKTMMHIRNRPYLKRAYNSILEHPNILLCHNSNSGAKSYSEWLENKKSEFPVIYNGADFEGIMQASLDGSIDKEWNALSIPSDALIIGSVFRFVNEKQPYVWIDTLIKVCKQNPKAYGIIIGSGGLMDASFEYLKEKGMEGRIFFPGQTRMVKAWLDKFDIFFLSSRIEGLPNVIIEAQGFGVPVISTNAGGASETIIDGVTGHIVNSHDPKALSEKIISVLDDKLWLESASEKAIEFSQSTFSKTSMIDRLLELYQMSLD
jgi:glycosyltransferase involved in cell wall biosynthesis